MMKSSAKRSLALMLMMVMLLSVFTIPAGADGTAIIGEITVTSRYSSNLRSGPGTNYPVAANASPGQVFPTTGLSGDFYELVMPNGSYTYLHKNLAAFTAYPVPQNVGAQYSLPVYYRTATGETLHTTNVSVNVGQNTITANDTLVPGYRLVSTRSVYVSVDATGRAFPSGVVFLYEPAYAQVTAAPVAATVPVFYKNIYGQVINSELRTLGIGTHLVRADSSKVPYGYYLTGVTDAVVFVSSYGVANPSSVSFVVIQQTATPVPTATPRPAAYATIPINYRDQNGANLFSTSQTLGVGYTTITANDTRVPAGYVLTSARSVSVYVNEYGTATPSNVVFTYRRPVSAQVQVIYQDNAGGVLSTETRTLAQGTHTITASDAKVPAGYVLASARSLNVTVDANGYATPGSVVFTYRKPVTASIQVVYKDTAGATLYTETRTLSQGSNAVTANDAMVPAGYLLQGYRSIAVTVNPDGSLSQSRVEFTYAPPAPPAPPVTVNIPVIYQDNNGATLNQTTVSVTSAQPNSVRADSNMVPQGYVLSSASPVSVRVSPDGTATPAQVVFTYRERGTVTTIPAIDTYQTVRLEGSHPVYAGPGTHYYQTPGAVVSGGRSRVYGSENGWILMGYGLSDGNYRIGWVDGSALPAGTTAPELLFANRPARATNLVRVYDDPIMKPTTVFEIQPGGTFTVLATQRDGYYAYIETEYNGQPYRGFVNQRNIQLQ